MVEGVRNPSKTLYLNESSISVFLFERGLKACQAPQSLSFPERGLFAPFLCKIQAPRCHVVTRDGEGLQKNDLKKRGYERVKLWAPGFPGAHFNGAKVGFHELWWRDEEGGRTRYPFEYNLLSRDRLREPISTGDGGIRAGTCLS